MAVFKYSKHLGKASQPWVVARVWVVARKRGPGVRSGKSGDTGGVGGEEGVGTHWQFLNFSKQLGTVSQVWVVATAVNGGVGVVRVLRARRGVGTHWQPSQVWVVARAVNGGGGGGGGGGEGGEGAEGCGHALAASKYSLNT